MIKQNKTTNWQEQFKIRPHRNASIKHEVIKTLLVLKLIEAHKSRLGDIRVYTEFPIGEGKVSDVYFENIKKGEIICYEIQKRVTDDWLERTKKEYDSFESFYFTTDWVLIKEDDLPDDIFELNKALDKYLI